MVLPVYDRTPYNVEYYKDGQKQTIRRVPPPKLHKIEEGDEAEIDELVPLNVGEDEEDDSDEVLATEGFSPIEGAEGGRGQRYVASRPHRPGHEPQVPG